MRKIYLFAGASSAIAKETALLLKAKGHRVIGISTKAHCSIYEEFYQIEKSGKIYNSVIGQSIEQVVAR